jgi:phosphatidylglycerophosphate synthase
MIVFTMLSFLVPAWPGYVIILRDFPSNFSRSAETMKAIGMPAIFRTRTVKCQRLTFCRKRQDRRYFVAGISKSE